MENRTAAADTATRGRMISGQKSFRLRGEGRRMEPGVRERRLYAIFMAAHPFEVEQN